MHRFACYHAVVLQTQELFKYFPGDLNSCLRVGVRAAHLCRSLSHKFSKEALLRDIFSQHSWALLNFVEVVQMGCVLPKFNVTLDAKSSSHNQKRGCICGN